MGQIQRNLKMSRLKENRIRKFNPGAFQSDQEVIAQFKVRHYELQNVLDILRDNIEALSCQHALIIGPRGQGKTMLLARTAAELRSDEQLSEDLLPVRFMEESHEIFNMADFWLETLFYLARECQQFDPQLGQELNTRHSILSSKWGSDSLEDLARNAVLDAADRLDRKLVLMIENLQALFEDVEENFGWKLRKVLQTEPQIIFIGSAISRFRGLDNAELPFFDFFWIIHLKPLNTTECQRLWTMISGQDVSERETRPLEILTGGSPRLLVIVASFAQHKSMHQLMEELVLLVDEHTDYFRGNLEVLPKTERRVFLAVIDLWQPSTPSEISIRARMDIRKVSTMLGRLVSRGAVIVEGSGRKRKYAAAERLYSIYYKLRRNRDEATVVQNLIRFMSVFYTEAEQTEVFSALIEEMAKSEVIREALDGVMAEDSRLTEKIVRTVFDKGDFAKVIQIVDQVLSSDVSQLRESDKAWAMFMKAAAYQEQGDLESAHFTLSEIINLWNSAEDPQLQYRVALAQTLISRILHVQGEEELALATVEKVVKDFGSKEVPRLQMQVACALITKGEILQDQHNLNFALEVFEEIVRRLHAVEDHEFQWPIAVALIYKGRLLMIQNQLQSALATFDRVIKRFGSSGNAKLQLWVGWAIINKAELQINEGNIQDGLSAYDEIIQRLADIKGYEKTELAWIAFQGKTKALLIQGDLPAAVDLFRSLYETLDPNSGEEIRVIANLVIGLVAAGVVPHTLLKILSDNDVPQDTLLPVIVALRQEAGETVRAPVEIREVASDIRKSIQEQRSLLIKERATMSPSTQGRVVSSSAV